MFDVLPCHSFFLFSRVDGDSNQAFSDSISGINIYDKVN